MSRENSRSWKWCFAGLFKFNNDDEKNDFKLDRGSHDLQYRFGVAIYNLAEDDVDKDRRQDLKMKGKHGLGGIRNGGFKKDAKFECGHWCQLELIFKVGDSAVALVGTAALGAGAL